MVPEPQEPSPLEADENRTTGGKLPEAQSTSPLCVRNIIGIYGRRYIEDGRGSTCTERLLIRSNDASLSRPSV